MNIPPERMTDAQVIEAMDGDSRFNAARKVFRFRSAELENLNVSPIENRRREFEIVLEIIDVFYGRTEGGLSTRDAFAVTCGNVPFEDSVVCDKCSGKGFTDLDLSNVEPREPAIPGQSLAIAVRTG